MGRKPRDYQQMAVRLAARSRAEDNRVHPKVGVVVERDGRILATAYRGQLGPGDHAEFTALDRHDPDLIAAGATVYATPEPCTTRNHPKVPCVQRLIDQKVKVVYVGMLDPNEKICGRGVCKLRRAGIHVQFFDKECADRIEAMNRNFIRLHDGGSSTRDGLASREATYVQIRAHGDPCDQELLRNIKLKVSIVTGADKVEIVGINPGSVIMTLRMSYREARRLIAAYRCGEFAEEGVLSCELFGKLPARDIRSTAVGRRDNPLSILASHAVERVLGSLGSPLIQVAVTGRVLSGAGANTLVVENVSSSRSMKLPIVANPSTKRALADLASVEGSHEVTLLGRVVTGAAGNVLLLDRVGKAATMPIIADTSTRKVLADLAKEQGAEVTVKAKILAVAGGKCLTMAGSDLRKRRR